MATKKNDFQKMLADREAQNPALGFISGKKDQDAPKPVTVTAPAASDDSHQQEEISEAAKKRAAAYFAQTGAKIDPALFELRDKRMQLLVPAVLFNRIKQGADDNALSINEYVCRLFSAATYTKED